MEKTNKNKTNRTQNIPIIPLQDQDVHDVADSTAQQQTSQNPTNSQTIPQPNENIPASETFQLGVQAAKMPHENKEQENLEFSSGENLTTSESSGQKQVSTQSQSYSLSTGTNTQPQQTKIPPKQLKPVPVRANGFSNLSVRIWNTLEWLATSAIIFMLVFFALNYESYGGLFWEKLNALRGKVTQNKYLENMSHSANPKPVEQKPLPIVKTPEQIKKQVPMLDIEVMPPDYRVVIPKINKNVPVVNVSSENLIKRDWSALEADIQEALRDGVVHYPKTAQPGEKGNVVITGHSSYFPWDPGRFRDVFAPLHDVVIGDEVIVFYNQKAYKYKISEIKKVSPSEVDVLTQSGEDKLTLITCTPIGTNWNRLIVIAKPI